MSATLYDTFGNEINYRIFQNTLVAYIDNATIKFPLPEASSTLLEAISNTENINPVELDLIQTKLEAIGFGKPAAKTMASVMIQVAQDQGVNPLTYFDDNLNSLKFTVDAYKTINLLRPSGNKIGLAKVVNNQDNKTYNKFIKP